MKRHSDIYEVFVNSMLNWQFHVLRDQRAGIREHSPGIWDHEPSHGIAISIFFRDQGSGCAIFVGTGINICHAFGIKDQNFWVQKMRAQNRLFKSCIPPLLFT